LTSEAPDEPLYLPTTNAIPLATGFKPALKVLSRKPAPKMVTKKDPVTGLEHLTLEDDEEEEEVKAQPTPEEIKARLQREREEKQRRYDEARAKIFGESKSSSPRSGSPRSGTLTPPQQTEGRSNHRNRSRGRGGGGSSSRNAEARSSETRVDAAGKKPAAPRELYDPKYVPKPGVILQKRAGDVTRTQSPRQDDQVIRAPRGPDASGRGGFGFGRRDVGAD
jgi:hypothetical protein